LAAGVVAGAGAGVVDFFEELFFFELFFLVDVLVVLVDVVVVDVVVAGFVSAFFSVAGATAGALVAAGAGLDCAIIATGSASAAETARTLMRPFFIAFSFWPRNTMLRA
jgi:hypothetical protein